MNAVETAKLRAIEAARQISESLEAERKRETKATEEEGEEHGLREEASAVVKKIGEVSEDDNEELALDEAQEVANIFNDELMTGLSGNNTLECEDGKDSEDVMAFDSRDLFADLFQDELLELPDDVYSIEVTTAMQMLEAPSLLSNRCFSAEDRKKLIGAVSIVYGALVAAEEKGCGIIDDRLEKLLSRATQSQDRVVATAARGARLKVHTKRRQEKSSLEINRPTTAATNASEDNSLLLRRDLERIRSQLIAANRKLAAESATVRSLRTSFNKAQRDWTQERVLLEREKAQALASAARWEQKAKQLATSHHAEQSEKAISQRRHVLSPSPEESGSTPTNKQSEKRKKSAHSERKIDSFASSKRSRGASAATRLSKDTSSTAHNHCASSQTLPRGASSQAAIQA